MEVSFGRFRRLLQLLQINFELADFFRGAHSDARRLFSEPLNVTGVESVVLHSPEAHLKVFGGFYTAAAELKSTGPSVTCIT